MISAGPDDTVAPDATQDATGAPALDATAAADATLDGEALVRPAAPEPPAALFAGRYAVGALLGRGAFGTVVAVRDTITGRELALKRVACVAPAQRSRLSREVAALRLLRLPGVIELVDDGFVGDEFYLVMERLAGRPFPGDDATGRLPWTRLEGPALDLLSVLGRVHAAGVLHRDLKPDNIWVEPDGRVVVLDFGLAAAGDVEVGLTRTGAFLGTPRYVAPEQIRGEVLDATADLYAVGLMLYERLTGASPHAEGDVHAVLARRLAADLPPVNELAPDVPAHVARAVDRLVARERRQRFVSADDAAAALRGADVSGQDPLPWLGPTAALRSAEAVLTGARRSVAVVGSSGSGRTRFVAELTRRLVTRGVPVVEVGAGQGPFASLQRLVAADAPSLEDLRTQLRRELAARVAAGEVFVVDDPERVDPWSLEELRALSRRGGVLSTGEDFHGRRVCLAPLSEAALRPLFGGLEPLLHQPTDAAAALWRLTRGHPRSVVQTLAEWRRRGLLRPAGDRVAIDRLGLDLLQREGATATAPRPVVRARRRGLETRNSASASSNALPLEGDLTRRLLDWLPRAWPHTTAPLLAAALGERQWRVEAILEPLVAAGAAEVHADGAYFGLSRHWASTEATQATREAHGRLAAALPPGAPGRVQHLVAAGDATAAVPEAVVVAAACRERGAAAAGLAVLQGVLPLARAQGLGSPHREALFAALVATAAGVSTTAAIDLALYELARWQSASDGDARHRAHAAGALEHAVTLLRALRHGTVGEASAAATALRALPPSAEAPVDLAQRVGLLRVGRTLDAAVWQAEIDELGRIAAANGWVEHWLEHALQLAQQAYVAGDFQAARERYAAAAGPDAPPAYRLRGLLGAAAAALEAFSSSRRIARRKTP